MLCKGRVFCSWAILVEPFNDSGTTLKKFEDCVEFFPNGFPDPLYEDGDDWINDPDEYPESTSYTGGNS